MLQYCWDYIKMKYLNLFYFVDTTHMFRTITHCYPNVKDYHEFYPQTSRSHVDWWCHFIFLWGNYNAKYNYKIWKFSLLPLRSQIEKSVSFEHNHFLVSKYLSKKYHSYTVLDRTLNNGLASW